MSPAFTTLCLLAGLHSAIALSEEAIVFAASRGNAPPLAFFEQETLRAGIIMDLGQAIAGQMGRQARFVALPRKRIEEFMASGALDAQCYTRPEWNPLPGLQWSRPVFADSDLIISASRVKAARSIKDLDGQPVGMVRGFHYKPLNEHPELVINRDDAPSMEHNLRKLATSRFAYAITNRLSLDYYQKIGDPPLSLHPPLVLERYQTYCALSPKSRIALNDFNHALDTLHQSGRIDKILARYR